MSKQTDPHRRDDVFKSLQQLGDIGIDTICGEERV